ncbi:MAG: PAS domain-containing protein, partial [Deltaproteobacteria bacterium]|nr:PAS domain-containing protein [Deltaproteobacteria bacterium]
MEPQMIQGMHQESFSRHAKLFEMLLEAIPSSVLLIDDQMRIVAVNKNFLEKNRKSREQAIGARLQDLLPEPLIEYMDITARVRQVFDHKMATRGGRMTYRAPGVPLRVYYYNILPFSWLGQVENVMLLMEDVTEQIRLGEEVVKAQRH